MKYDGNVSTESVLLRGSLKGKGNYSLILKTGLASFDQAILSLVNLLVSLILLKFVSKEEFGYYSLSVTIVLLVISIQNAIIGSPLAVLLAVKSKLERSLYVNSLCYGQFIVLLPSVILGLFVFELLNLLSILSPVQTKVALAVSLGMLCVVLREFSRSYYFANEDAFTVVQIDVLYIVLLGGFLCVLCFFFTVRIDLIFLAMGVINLIVYLLFQMEKNLTVTISSIKQSYQENWKFGKWAFLGVIVSHAESYSYLYILGIILGSAAVAEVSASRLIIAPLLFFQSGWGRISVPHGAKLSDNGNANTVLKQQTFSTVLLIGIVIVYTILLWLFANHLEKHLLGDKYSDALNYVPFWSAICALKLVSQNASFGLQSLKKFDVITKMNLLTMVITITSSYPLIAFYGIRGALTSLCIGGFLLGVGLWVAFFREARRAVPFS